MTIDLQLDSRVLIQGIDNPLALAAIGRMQTYGPKIAGIVSAGQGGQELGDLPMFDLVEQAQSVLGPIETSLIFVSAYQVLDAALEAIAAGIPQLIVITRGVPPLDMIRLLRQASISNTLVLGTGSAGIIIPDRLLLGIYQPQSEFDCRNCERIKSSKFGSIDRHSYRQRSAGWLLLSPVARVASV